MYAVLCSALIASSRSDLETQLISRWTSLYLAPLGFIASWLGWSGITPLASLLGIMIGFGIPYSIVRASRYIYGMDGLGIGDCDLLALIGAFLGAHAAWTSLFLGALSATIIATPFLLTGHLSRKSRIPFGPFIALGAYITIMAGPQLLRLFMLV